MKRIGEGAGDGGSVAVADFRHAFLAGNVEIHPVAILASRTSGAVPRPLPPRHFSGNTIITPRMSLPVTATLTDV